MELSTPLVIGEVLFDCFPSGHRVLGGAPFNVAWHLRGFGLDPLFLSAIGKDEMGSEILTRMKQAGLRRDGLQELASVATGRVDVKDADTAPSYHFPETSAWDCFDLAAASLPPEAPLLYQGSLFLRREQSREASLALARRFGGPRFVDINLRPPWYSQETVLALIDRAHCLKASKEELAQVARWLDLDPPADLAECALAVLRAASIEHLFVTRGKDGAVWVSHDGSIAKAPAASVDSFIDSVGAGDASAAVAIHGLLHDWPIPLLLERAMDFAARICGLPGAIPADATLYHEVSRKWN